MAYILEFGGISGDLHVCHRCDVRNCCRPSHLFLGTNEENVEDKVRKGRQARNRGERHGMVKLTADKVLAIRARVAAGERQRAVADEYGVDKTTISLIVCGKSWAHLPLAAKSTEVHDGKA